MIVYICQIQLVVDSNVFTRGSTYSFIRENVHIGVFDT